MLMGTSFVVSVFLQKVRGYSAIKTGVIFTAATLGLLVSSLAAERLAKRRAQKTLIVAGFVVTLAGIVLLIGLVAGVGRASWPSCPGLLLVGLGLGAMLTPSVNVVQSSFPEALQGEISGLSRSVSNLGSSLRHRDRRDDPRRGRRRAGTAPTPGRWRRSPCSGSSGSSPRSACPRKLERRDTAA